jgi:hypothetical protein
MAVLLSHLLKANNAGAMAVFQILRRSSAQRDAIFAAGKTVLTDPHLELLSALLSVHKSIEPERNALAHGTFGVCDELPNDLLWQEANDIVQLRARFHMEPGFTFDEAEMATHISQTYVYRHSDLERIRDDIRELWGHWFHIREYLHWFGSKPTTAGGEQYLQLCDRPRIAQELARMRRENTP